MFSLSHQNEVTTPCYENERTTTVAFSDLTVFPATARPTNVCNLLHTSLCHQFLSEILLVHLEELVTVNSINPNPQSEFPGPN